VLQPCPHKRNLVPRFMKEGSIGNDEGCIDGIPRRTTRQLKGGRLPGANGGDGLQDN
jgi:hypothetical protein